MILQLQSFEAAGNGKDHITPMWMAGDHLMVAWGQVAQIPSVLFFIDTGLAGAGVKLAESTIKRAGIRVQVDKASVGEGAGGQMKVVPFVVR